MQGRFAQAEVLFRETLAAQDRVEGVDHPDAMATRASLATMLSDAGRFDESERLWRDLLGRMQRVLGRDHPDTANCLVGLAAIEVHRGHREAALRLLEEAVKVDSRWAASLAANETFAPLKGNPAFEKLAVPPGGK